MISLIAARADNGVIGSENDLPWYLPSDLRRFKELTTNHSVVMGRKTYESIMQRLGHPLPNRLNIVLTRQDNFSAPSEVQIIHDLAEIKTLPGEVFVIGGAEIYAQTIGLAEKIYLTEVKADINGDSYFPSIDPSNWRETARQSYKKDDKNQYDYDFVVFERI